MICRTCQADKPLDSFNPDSFSPDDCFRCRVSGISFTNPIKTGQGDDAWRHDTISASVRRQVAEAKANGLDPQPKYTAGGYTPSQTQLDRLKAK